MKQKWWILLTLLLCGCGASSQPDQTGAVQNDRPRLSASMEETAENVAAVEKNENLEKNSSNSNQNPGEGQNWTVFAMDTVMQFDAYGGSTDLQEKVKRRVEELEGEFSTTQENSDIFHLNQEKTTELSADTRYLMQEALALGAETDGALDISIYPVVQSWGFTTGNYRVPSESERESLLKSVDYRLVGLEADTASIEPGMMVDLGGVGKGFTGDEVVKTMKEDGVTSALFSLGGNIQTIGTKPDGEKWYVGIKDPESDGYLGGVRVQDEAVITSGGYERYFTDDDGTIYWHIMDPSTGAPAHSGLISVTIIGPCGLRCDGLSTALFVMGREKAAAHWAAHQDYEAVLVDESGTIWLTPGLKDRFIPVDQGETREIRIL